MLSTTYLYMRHTTCSVPYLDMRHTHVAFRLNELQRSSLGRTSRGCARASLIHVIHTPGIEPLTSPVKTQLRRADSFFILVASVLRVYETVNLLNV